MTATATKTKKAALKVVTPFGTFTRTTARTYTHLVIAKGERAELLEAERLAGIKERRKKAAQYAETQRTGIGHDLRPAGTVGGDWDRKCTAEYVAEGQYERWAIAAAATADKLEADGVITADRGSDFGVLGWSGRLDLARKVASTDIAARYRTVIIIDALTGEVVR
jgi:hypothetical protein